jgi:cyclopropane fatty-acyl-phospholipid synthase-like methyltransferase
MDSAEETRVEAADLPTFPTDDRTLWDVVAAPFIYPAFAVAHQLRLFSLLAKEPRTAAELSDAMKIALRPTNALVSTCAALGLLSSREQRFELTPVARTYLLEDSPYYIGAFIELEIGNADTFRIETVKKAVLTDKSQVYSGEELFKSNDAQTELARIFTKAMHAHSAAAAQVWPSAIDLSDCHQLLDIGGGSGVHAIGAALRWRHLKAVIFETPTVCPIAQEYIARAGLHERVKTYAGDFWTDPFPVSDAHFYADVYHDWPPNQGRYLARKSYDSLPVGGRIILHEMLFNHEKTGPLTAAGYSTAMLLWTEGQQYTGQELGEILTDAGFTEVEINPSLGYFSVITGVKR